MKRSLLVDMLANGFDRVLVALGYELDWMAPERTLIPLDGELLVPVDEYKTMRAAVKEGRFYIETKNQSFEIVVHESSEKSSAERQTTKQNGRKEMSKFVIQERAEVIYSLVVEAPSLDAVQNFYSSEECEAHLFHVEMPDGPKGFKGIIRDESRVPTVHLDSKGEMIETFSVSFSMDDVAEWSLSADSLTLREALVQAALEKEGCPESIRDVFEINQTTVRSPDVSLKFGNNSVTVILSAVPR